MTVRCVMVALSLLLLTGPAVAKKRAEHPGVRMVLAAFPDLAEKIRGNTALLASIRKTYQQIQGIEQVERAERETAQIRAEIDAHPLRTKDDFRQLSILIGQWRRYARGLAQLRQQYGEILLGMSLPR